MEVLTAWVKPPPQVGGLDHLAVQAPCINIYGRMLPGVTNVTDRARYYAFYPWIIWALDNAGHSRYDDHFVDLFRRADCLFTLIAERHALVAGDEYDQHGAAMVGSNTLSSVARELAESGSMRLSDYASREGAKRRYFMNKLGGLGQYYLGVLRELNVLDGDTARGIKYTRELGQDVAERMDVGINRKLFLDLVEGDVVGTEPLDTLADFCPCRLTGNLGEQAILSDLFFVREGFFDVEVLPRRRSLQSLLFLASALADEDEQLSEAMFRGCMYTGALPGGARWSIPESLDGNRRKWATYARNELLSLAVQGLFFVLLDSYEESGLRFSSPKDLVTWCLGQPETHSATDEIGLGVPFSEIVRNSSGWLPELHDWGNPEHEIQLGESLVWLCKKPKSAGNRHRVMVNAMKILIALTNRTGERGSPYGELVFQEDYFRYYPINLRSFAHYSKNDWQGLETEALLGWLFRRWGVDVHLRVALRKLRGQSQSTFRLRPSDRGLEVIGIPPAIHTRPRFNQAVRILKDVGALTRGDGEHWVPSGLGSEIMELGDAP